jgi:hypothetical protein
MTTTQMFLHWDVGVGEEHNVKLLMSIKGAFVAKGWIIACDPKEALFNDDLGEDHVGILILYYPNDISTIMSIWGWPLS